MIAASDALSYVKAALRSHEGPKGVDESYDAWAIRMIRVDTLQTLAAGLEEALSHTPGPEGELTMADNQQCPDCGEYTVVDCLLAPDDGNLVCEDCYDIRLNEKEN